MVPLVNVPSPEVLQEIVPLVAVYPAGIVYEPSPAQTVAEAVVPAVAIGAGSIVSANVAVAGGHTPTPVTVMVKVMTPPAL